MVENSSNGGAAAGVPVAVGGTVTKDKPAPPAAAVSDVPAASKKSSLPRIPTDVIHQVMLKHKQIIAYGQKHFQPSWKIDIVLADLLFSVSEKAPGFELVRVLDREQLKTTMPAKYAGQLNTMLAEGLIPPDVAASMQALGLDRHIGPSYLKVKMLMTSWEAREFFARQVAYRIREWLKANVAPDPERFIQVIPNMTGGAQVGDSIAKHLHQMCKGTGYRILPATPYMRDMRKETKVGEKGERINNHVEGFILPPERVLVNVIVEELMTVLETTGNAAKKYRQHGYTKENGVTLLAASVFNYGHPVGEGRAKALGLPTVYATRGAGVFGAGRNMRKLSPEKLENVEKWLANCWAWTMDVLPDMKAQMDAAAAKAAELKRAETPEAKKPA